MYQAALSHRLSPSLRCFRALCLAALTLAGSLAGTLAGAEKADRGRAMTLESDKPCTVNLLRQTSVCSGNVTISQGTLLIRAEKIELRETPDGYQMASASGGNGWSQAQACA